MILTQYRDTPRLNLQIYIKSTHKLCTSFKLFQFAQYKKIFVGVLSNQQNTSLSDIRWFGHEKKHDPGK